jgi:hypothetical protein
VILPAGGARSTLGCGSAKRSSCGKLECLLVSRSPNRHDVRHLASNTATITEISFIGRSLPIAVQPRNRPAGSDRGGLGEGNFLAQPHLQQFDFD